MNIDAIKKYISYNSETGELTYIKSGKKCSRLDKDGYVRVSVSRQNYLGHRVAWVLHYGEEPATSIDHKNRVRNDNRIDNLRLATVVQQSANRNTAVKGIHKKGNRWRAKIHHLGEVIWLGSYECPLLARMASIENTQKLHGEYSHI